MNTQNNKSMLPVYIAWGLVAFFFLFQYTLRVVPGVMVNELREAYHITAEQFSLFGAMTLYAYGAMQIPIGALLDSVGVKKTVIMCLSLCIAGTLIMGVSDSLYLAYFSRFLIGAGSSCAFITCLKIVGDNFSQGKRGFLMGVTLTMGTVGALMAGKPLSFMMGLYGWQQTLINIGLFGFLILAAMFMFMPKREKFDKKSGEDHSWETIKQSLKDVAKTRRILLYAVLAVGAYTPLAVISDLWGPAFLMSKFNCTQAEAASAVMNIYVGLCIGSFLIPGAFERMKRLNFGIKVCFFGIVLTFAAILYAPVNFATMSFLLFTLGCLCGSEMMCFTGVTNSAPEGKNGMALGFTNTLNMFGGAVLQHMIGIIIDYFWSGEMSETGLRIYGVETFTTAFSFLMGLIVVCFILSLTLKKDTPTQT